MDPRQARRERREAERKTKKLELKKNRLAENHPLAAVEEFPEIQPRWNPELEDEFPREVQIRHNAMLDLRDLKAGRPIPPPGPTPGPFPSLAAVREHFASRVRDAHLPPVRPETLIDPKPNAGPLSQRRAEINRANAQLSTGPRSFAGKSSSSRNATTHGLASGQLIVPGEDPAQFESLLAALLNDHQPADSTEELLVNEMAQSHWLAQRAIRFQNECFSEQGVDQKGLALFLRYFTTHNRAFHKALADLQRTQKERLKLGRGFVSQSSAETASDRQFVRQNDPQPPVAHQSDVGSVSQTEPTINTERGQIVAEAA